MTSNNKSLTVFAGVAVSILSLSLSAPADAASFSGPYAPANFTLVNRDTNGSVDASTAPESVTITGGNNSSLPFGTTDYISKAATSGLLSFDWNYFTQDKAGYFDPFSFVVNGRPTNIFSGLSPESQGSFSQAVNAGDFFSFRIATDNLGGAGSVKISNFNVGEATAVPTPALLPGLFALGFGVLRKRKSEKVAAVEGKDIYCQ